MLSAIIKKFHWIPLVLILSLSVISCSKKAFVTGNYIVETSRKAGRSQIITVKGVSKEFYLTNRNRINHGDTLFISTKQFTAKN